MTWSPSLSSSGNILNSAFLKLSSLFSPILSPWKLLYLLMPLWHLKIKILSSCTYEIVWLLLIPSSPLPPPTLCVRKAKIDIWVPRVQSLLCNLLVEWHLAGHSTFLLSQLKTEIIDGCCQDYYLQCATFLMNNQFTDKENWETGWQIHLP